MVLARQVAVCSGASQAGCTCSVPFPAAGQVRFVALWGDCASPEFAECLGVAKCTLGVKVLLAREIAVLVLAGLQRVAGKSCVEGASSSVPHP